MLAIKRKLKNVSFIQKCNVIRLTEKGMINKAACEKFGIPRNIILTWKKNQNKLLQSLEQKLRGCDYEQVNKAILKWFSLQGSQNIPIDGTMIKGKALFFAENFNFSNFKASDGWMDKLKKGKEKNIYTVNKKFNLKVYFKVYSR